MGNETEYDDGPLISATQGDRSAIAVRVTVSHDLGDRTLVVVILLMFVIGACTTVMGRNMARQDALEQYTRELAAKHQVTTNHVTELEAQLKARRYE